jgi:hypothetical protein
MGGGVLMCNLSILPEIFFTAWEYVPMLEFFPWLEKSFRNKKKRKPRAKSFS